MLNHRGVYHTQTLYFVTDIDGLMLERRNSSALAMELHLSCITHRYDLIRIMSSLDVLIVLFSETCIAWIMNAHLVHGFNVFKPPVCNRHTLTFHYCRKWSGFISCSNGKHWKANQHDGDSKIVKILTNMFKKIIRLNVIKNVHLVVYNDSG